MVSCLSYCGRQPQDISTWVSFSVFPVSSSCSLPRFPLLVMTMSLLQPCEVLSHLLKYAFRENFENVSNKAWLAYPPREKARRRKLTWRLPNTSEPETYELISRVITYWSPHMCRHCPVMWTGRVVAQEAWGHFLWRCCLNLYNHIIQENQALSLFGCIQRIATYSRRSQRSKRNMLNILG